MAIPAAKVETRIVLSGQNQASKPIREAHKDLKDLTVGAGTMGKSIEESGRKVMGASGDIESSLGSLRDFLPGISDELNIVAQSGGAVEAALRLLGPAGPVGLAVVALGAAGIAAYALGTAARESAAAIELLGDKTTEAFADKLGIGVKEAAGLQAQMRQLPEALRPSAELLDRVGRNAERLGAEPVDAQKALISALINGGDAVKDFEQSYGKLPSAIGSVADAVRAAGLDPELLGVGPKAKSLSDQAVAAALARAKAESEVAIATDKVAIARKELREASGTADKSTASLDLAAAQKELDTKVAARSEAGKAAAALGEQVRLSREFTDSLEASDEQLRDIAATEDQRIRNGEMVVALQDRQELISRQLAELDKMRMTLGEEAYAAELKRLQGLEDAAISGLRDQARESERIEKDAATKRQQRASKAAADNKRRRDEERSAALAAVKAQDALLVAQLESDPATAAAAIRAKAFQEVQDVLRDSKKSSDEQAALIKGITLKRDKELEDLATAAAARSQALRDSVLDADLDLAEQRTQIAIDSARERGDEETAVQLERQVIAEKMSRDLVDLERQAVEQRKGLYDQDLINFEQSLQRRRQAITEAAGAADAQLAAPKGPDTSGIVAGLDTAMGALEGVSGKSGKALLAAANGAKSIAGAWKDAKSAAPGIIGAVGSVAESVLEGERSKAGVLALMSLAQGTALAFVPGKQAEAAGAFAASAIYGLVAGGVIGGGSGGSRAAAPSASGDSQGGFGSQGGGFGGNSGGPKTVNIFYGMLGTKQEAGLLANKALQSLRGTGFGGAK